ncbi:uncharacterized protein LOC121373807 [Gigantopelta aegis]|uniref:uncharacterized protein LOC121373807 n=1 Tax=Gigantopelta aegis TaxID=1735272 RepID=UPI001B889D42|nr:uncharacterized protein LOC121373807 [Gigantopelta aegis]
MADFKAAGNNTAKACTAMTTFFTCLKPTGCENIPKFRQLIAQFKAQLQKYGCLITVPPSPASTPTHTKPSVTTVKPTTVPRTTVPRTTVPPKTHLPKTHPPKAMPRAGSASGVTVSVCSLLLVFIPFVFK